MICLGYKNIPDGLLITPSFLLFLYFHIKWANISGFLSSDLLKTYCDTADFYIENLHEHT